MARRTYDRTGDVPKLVGCNTRNVNYRWSIFLRHLEELPVPSRVLDFGAGSLRETFELSKRGFNVVSIDIDEATMTSYFADYDWSDCQSSPTLVADTDVSRLSGNQFSLITAFDVFEHLADPKELIAQMVAKLGPGGLIFCTVPNRRTLFEILSRIKLKAGLAIGHKFAPGEPHLQFNSPEEWHSLFERAGLRVLEHDMAIGPLVNTWASLISMATLPLRRLGLKVDRLGGFLAGPRVMSTLDAIDRNLKTWSRGLYGWNLFVLAPAAGTPVRVSKSAATAER